MRGKLWYTVIFLLVGMFLPCLADTYSIDTWNSTNPLYKSDFNTNSTLNFTADITDTTTSIGTYLGGAKTLNFNGSGSHFLSGNSAYYGFEVQSGGSYTFDSLTIKNFTSSSASIGGFLTVDSGGSSTIKNSTFNANTNTTGNGGAIYNSGTLTIGTSGGSDTTKFINNVATSSSSNGGAIYNTGTLNIYSGVSFAGNYTGTTGLGGAIYTAAGLTIDSATFKWNGFNDYNSTQDKSIGGSSNISTQYGGAIRNSSTTVTISSTTFRNNAASSGAGAINNYNGTLNLNSGNIFAGNYTGTSGKGGALYISGSSSVATITSNIFKWNGYNDYDSVNDYSTSYHANPSDYSHLSTTTGGAIYNTSGTVNLINSTFNNNVVTSQGGVIYGDANATVKIGASGSNDTSIFKNNAAFGSGATGGVIYNMGIFNSYNGVTYSGNYTDTTGAGGVLYNHGTATITGDTFSWNGYSNYNGTSASTISTANGGVAYNASDGTITITNSTFNNNAATSQGGVINNAGTLTIATNGQTTDTTTFTNNNAYNNNATGGAIKNTGTLNSYGGVKYLGNYTGHTGTLGGNGGAIYNDTANGVFTITGNTFSYNGYDNYNGTSGSEVSTANGGAIYNNSTSSTASTITNSTFNNNAVSGYGGAIYNKSGALTLNSGNIFAGNFAAVGSACGGAIYNASTSAVTITGNTFKWNGASDYNPGTDTATNHVVYSGGAIENDTGTNMTITASSFYANTANSGNGGAIYNLGTLAIGTSGSTDTTTFTKNNVVNTGYGGAICNKATLNIYGGVIFAGNYEQSGYGGAIYNSGVSTTANIIGVTFKWNGYSNYSVGTDTATTVLTQYGGAIYNTTSATLTITDSTFTHNAATGNGGAIYNLGTLYLKATAGNSTSFTTATDTVYLGNATTYLNAGKSGASTGMINFNANVTSSAIGNVIEINNTTGDASLTTGTINFNAQLSTATLNLRNGTLQFGANASAPSSTYVSSVNLGVYGGTLSLQNNQAGDVLNINNFTMTGGNIYLDANLATSTSDQINIAGTVGSGSTATLGNLNIKADSAGSSGSITIFTGTGASSANLSYAGVSAYTSAYKYTFSPDATKGIFDYTRVADASALNDAVADTSAMRTFSATADTTLAANLGSMGGANSTLNIYGNGYSINGAGYSGIGVASGQKLLISGVGSVAGGKSWNGQSITGSGSVVNNAGSVTILNSVFSNNQATGDGGAFYNTGTLTIGTSGGTDTSLFIKNHTTTSSGAGGAIYNSGTLNIYNGVTFAGNYTEATRSGGAIRNAGTANIDGATFKWNGYSDYNSGTDTASTPFIQYGGAIINLTPGILTISNSTFRNNAVTGGSSSGGALNINSGTVHLNSGNIFAGNYSVGGIGGGAIINPGTLTITSNTFKWNGYGNYNSITDTATTVSTTAGGAIYNNSSAITTINNSTFNNNAATTNGGGIYSLGTLTLGTSGQTNDTTTFTNNNAYNNNANGGAIYNSGTFNSYGGVTYSGNYTGHTGSLGGSGGAIYQTGASAVATIVGNTFQWNGYLDYNGTSGTTVTTYNGGAIFNDTSAKLTITNSTFSHNASTNQGGAIVNNVGTLTITGSTFNNNSTAWNGGAIYNESGSTATITDSIFNNNNSASNGGAIRNVGTLYIKASATGTTSFTGNTSTNGADISSSANVYFNAGGSGGSAGSITMGDTVNVGTNTIYVNNTSGDATWTTGAVTFADTITAGTLDVAGGYANVYKYIALSKLNLTGGLTTIGDGTNTVTYNNEAPYTLSTAGNLTFNKTAFSGTSRLTLNSATSTMSIINSTFDGTNFTGNNHVLTNSAGVLLSISGSTFSKYTTAQWGSVINGYTPVTIRNSTFSQNASTVSGGAIYTSNSTGLTIGVNDGSTDTTLFSRNHSASTYYGGAIYSDRVLNSYKGATFAGNYATYGGAIYMSSSATGITIAGNTFKYNGYSDYDPANEASTHTIFAAVGGAISLSSAVTGTVSSSTFNYNATSDRGGAIYTGATLNITNSAFAYNRAGYAGGGAIYNTGTLNIGTSGSSDTSSFISNAAAGSGPGSAIWNSGTMNLYSGIIFGGNFGSTANGGAIYNTGASAVATITGNTFKWNGYSDYDSVNDYSTSYHANPSDTSHVSTANGGAIYNNSTSSTASTITNSTFNNNAATTDGGAIYNTGKLTIGTDASTADSTLFRNNAATSSSGKGGAIYNTGTLNSICATGGSVITYAGNYTGHAGALGGNGGAIYNTGASAVATITGNTFSWNGYYDYNGTSGTNVSTANGGAIYNTTNARAIITSSTFTSNAAIDGGAIYNTSSSATAVTITNSTFNNNIATDIAGAIYNNSGMLTIGTSGSSADTTSFTNNYAPSSGGAIYTANNINSYGGVTFAGNYTDGYGGAIDIDIISAVVTLTGNTFKWNGYSNYNGTSANAIATDNAGAVANWGTLNIVNSTFSHNAAYSQSGAIYNIGTLTIGTNASTADSTSFANNNTYNVGSYGGAIYNDADAFLNSICATGGNVITYAGNYTGHMGAPGGLGGAIYNAGTATIIGNNFNYNGYRDYNGTSGTNITTYFGGAIYNGSTVKIANSTFTNNAVRSAGGAIYNDFGTILYIQADGASNQTLFSGNKVNGVSNAIYLAGIDSTTNAAKLYFNAGNSGVININDGIAGSNFAYNFIYLNSSDATASKSFLDGSTVLTSGTINLNGDITGNTVYDYAGTTNFGQSGSSATGYYSGTAFNLSGGTQYFNNGISGATITASAGTQNFNSAIASSTITSTGGTQNIAGAMSASTLNVSGGTVNLLAAGSIGTTALNLNSGTLDLRNGQTDTLALTNFSANSAATLQFDANLFNNTNDKITVSGIASGTLTGLVNVTADATTTGGTLTLVTGSNISGLTLSNIATTYTTNYTYTFTGSTNGTYTINRNYRFGLNSAVAATEAVRTYSATADESLGANLGTMGGANSSLTIFGNNNSINGLGYGGITVSSGQTLNISGVGSLASSKSWNGFVGTSGGAINNSGTTTITNSVVKNNSATTSGGAVYNNTGAILNITNSTFNNNVATASGGAIYNLGTATITDSIFTGNTATTNGGAIFNAGDLYLKATAGGTTSLTIATDTIHLASGNVYLNAGAGGNITLNGAITSAASSNAININSAAGDASLVAGTISFNNTVSSATINVANGTVNFNSSAVSSDIINATGGTTNFNSSTLSTNIINLSSGTANISSGTTSSGNTINVSGATLNINGATLPGDTINISAGTANFNSNTHSSSDTINISGGTTNSTSASFSGDTISISGGTTSFNSSVLSANIIGISSGTANFNSGTTSSSDTLNISGGTTTFTSSTLSNDTLNVTGGNQTFTNSTFNNGTRIVLNNTILGESTILNHPTFTASGTYSGDGGAIRVSNGTLNVSNTSFNNYSATGNGGAICNNGSLTTSYADFVSNQAFLGGAVYNNGTANISNSTFRLNTAVNGGAIYNPSGKTVTFTDTSFIGNVASSDGGAIYNAGTVNINANNSDVVFNSNKANTNTLNAIYLANGSTLNLKANGGKITFNDPIASGSSTTINVNGTSTSDTTNGVVTFNKSVSVSNTNLYGGTLSLGADNLLDGNNLNLYGGTLNLANGTIGTMSLGALNIHQNSNVSIDANLANSTSDYIKANSVSGTGQLNIKSVNVIGDAVNKNTTITVVNPILSSYVTSSATTAIGPIYRYNLSYNSSTGTMNFVNAMFNSEVQAPVAANSIGTFLNQVNTYNEALSRSDVFMSLPYSDRLLMRYQNRYASAGGSDVEPTVFSPTFLPEASSGLWLKEYTTFENVPLNNGPNVSNVSYGALIGGDTELTHLKHGFDGYMSLYVGYNGSHQNFEDVGIYQNGGSLGITGTVYKGNFFASATANVGDSNGNASSTAGNNYFNTLFGGVATKTGYNIEFMRGKIILQPAFTMSYTFAKTLDYKTAAGANITSDPLNTIQIAPGVKLIGNLKNGWQPYIGVNMVWNVMDVQKFYANNVPLPQMSIAPYVEYGGGIQRRWGDRFTGFGQVMFRGGGRNGVAFQFGFRYAFGK